MKQNKRSFIQIAGYNVYAGNDVLIRNLNVNFSGPTAFIGPTGCGKSTLLKSLVGLWKQCDGMVKFAGKLGTMTSEEFIKRNVIYIPQDPYVARDMTVKELLCYPYSVNHTTDIEAIQVLSIILKFPLDGDIISKLN